MESLGLVRLVSSARDAILTLVFVDQETAKLTRQQYESDT
jgi:hypothetical protein